MQQLNAKITKLNELFKIFQDGTCEWGYHRCLEDSRS